MPEENDIMIGIPLGISFGIIGAYYWEFLIGLLLGGIFGTIIGFIIGYFFFYKYLEKKQSYENKILIMLSRIAIALSVIVTSIFCCIITNQFNRVLLLWPLILTGIYSPFILIGILIRNKRKRIVVFKKRSEIFLDMK